MIIKYLNMTRKIRLNELNDDFEYLIQDYFKFFKKKNFITSIKMI